MAAAVIVGAGCVSETRRSQPIGEQWVIDRVRVSGWEPSHAHLELRRGRDVVDVGVKRYHFFAPDCVVYVADRGGPPVYAVCGDRVPALLPEWVDEVHHNGVWGGDRIREGRREWAMCPIEPVLTVARRQPRLPSSLLTRLWGGSEWLDTPAGQTVHEIPQQWVDRRPPSY